MVSGNQLQLGLAACSGVVAVAIAGSRVRQSRRAAATDFSFKGRSLQPSATEGELSNRDDEQVLHAAWDPSSPGGRTQNMHANTSTQPSNSSANGPATSPSAVLPPVQAAKPVQSQGSVAAARDAEQPQYDTERPQCDTEQLQCEADQAQREQSGMPCAVLCSQAGRACSWSAHQYHIHAHSHAAASMASITQQHPHGHMIKQLMQACNARSHATAHTPPHNPKQQQGSCVHGTQQPQVGVQYSSAAMHAAAEHFNSHTSTSTTSSSNHDRQGMGWDGAAGWHVPLPPPGPLPAPLHESACVMVDTAPKLAALAETLTKVNEFALDTEHHASHSYLGVTCLIQVSTGGCEYLIDTLKLWRLIGPMLSSVFAAPHITKVVHGGANDVLWLQRDFKLYLVNIFDTEKAAAALGFTTRSLAYLLESLCGVVTDKRFQLSDWRRRPLTQAMQDYARIDVHYLQHIAAVLRARLYELPATVALSRRGLAYGTMQHHSSRNHTAHGVGAAVAEDSSDLQGDAATEAAHAGGMDASEEQSTGHAYAALVAAVQQDQHTAQPLITTGLAVALYRSQQLTLQLYCKHSHAEEVMTNTHAMARQLAVSMGHHHQAAGFVPAATAGAAGKAGRAGQASPAGSSMAKIPSSNGNEPSSTQVVTTDQCTVVGPSAYDVAVAQLEVLACWRDIQARTVDVSPQLVVSNNQLMALVLAQPQDGHQALEVLHLHGWHAAVPSRWQHSRSPTITNDGDAARSDQDAEGAQVASMELSGRPDHSKLVRWLAWPITALWQWGRQPHNGAGQDWKQASHMQQLLRTTAAHVAAGMTLPSPLGLTTINGASTMPPSKGRLATHKTGAGGQVASRGQAQLSALQPEKREAVIRKFAAKSAVYSNCVMLSHDGQKLCHCDQRKLEWYISKGIAERVADDPPTIRLLFEHKNTDQLAGEQFYSQSKSNRCVVCGETQHYLRYRVVPSCYRSAYFNCVQKHLPVSMKSHRSHDVVLLCVACHQTAHAAAEATKQQVALDYGIPLNPPPTLLADATAAATAGAAAARQAATPDAGGTAAAITAAMTAEQDDGDNADSDVDVDEVGVGVGLDADAGMHVPSSEPTTMSAPTETDSTAQAWPAGAANARRAAQALRKAGEGIPAARKQMMEHAIKRALGRDPATEPAGLRAGDMEAALMLGLSSRKRSRLVRSLPADVATIAIAAVQSVAAVGGEGAIGGGHAWHGQQVVRAALARGGEEELHQLIARFRAAFVAQCRPRFLPDSWQVQHRAARQYGDFSIFNPALPSGQRAASMAAPAGTQDNIDVVQQQQDDHAVDPHRFHS